MRHTARVKEHPDNPVFGRLAAEPNAVLWSMSLAGEILEVSPTVEVVRGISVEQAKSQSADEIHPPESLRVSLAYFERFSRDLLAGKEPEPFHADLEYRCSDGSTVWCEVVAVPMVADNGDIVALDGVSAPINGERAAARDHALESD